MRKALILAFFLATQVSWAQKDSLPNNDPVDSILSLIYQLPPLEELLELSVSESHLVKSRTALVEIRENQFKKVKNDWLSLVSLRGSIGYGNSIVDLTQNNLQNPIASNINTVLFNVGVIVQFSPEYWANRKHDIKIFEAYVDYENALKGEAGLIIAKKITDAYLELEYYKNIYLKASAGYESNRSTLRLVKKRFIEGDIDIVLYNDIILKNLKLGLEIENYKQNLKKAFYNLQRLLPPD
ncbi:MAG: outer membrane protein TolC [Aureispira sp.]|jgi:outer membrane protein TolC